MSNSSIKLRSNHKFISASGLMRQICAPLKHLKIHMFSYLKIFNDGSEINLSTHPEWIVDYYQLGLYQTSEFENSYQAQQKGFKWWPLESALAVFQHGREHFSSYYGLTYCLPQADGCVYFFFSTDAENYNQLEYYWNHLDLLEHFIAYFRDKSADLIKECEGSRLVLPAEFRQTPAKYLLQNNETEVAVDRQKFLTALMQHKGDALLLFLQDYEPLTKRERQCLELLLQESTATRIAEKLNLSVRTVEDYLERIKSKLGCSTKQELIVRLTAYSSKSLIKMT